VAPDFLGGGGLVSSSIGDVEGNCEDTRGCILLTIEVHTWLDEERELWCIAQPASAEHKVLLDYPDTL